MAEDEDDGNVRPFVIYYDDLDEVSEDVDASNESMGSNATIPDISYDTSLPTQHSYLGTDLEELSGRTVLDEGSIEQMPLLALPGVVLLPGQTLPLQFVQNAVVATLKQAIEKDRIFGMLHMSPHTFGIGSYSASLASVGTTAEVRSFREERDEATSLSTLKVKCEGRQRFSVLETWRKIDGVLMGRVQVLPEIILSDPGTGVRPSSLDKFKVTPTPNLDQDLKVKRIHAKRNKYNRHDFANCTLWPSWVYKQYDVQTLMERLKHELRGWQHEPPNSQKSGETVPFDSSKGSCSKLDPCEFSFWVAANLPLEDSLRLSLLAHNSAVQRLRACLSILEKCTVICCHSCGIRVAHRDDVFSMSQEGPQATYVNPYSYVYETLTVQQASNLSLVGRPSNEFSWFPGYAWTIVQCRNCHAHMGWKFTSESRDLQPQKFWGLRRSSLHHGLQSEQGEQQRVPII